MILLAGANGRLGRAIIELLGPEHVVAAVRHPAGRVPGLEELQVASPDSMQHLPWHRIRAVINAAGISRGSEEALMAANLAYTIDLARAAREGGVPRFIQISSFSVYGHAEHIGLETPEAPVSAYGQSKALCDGRLAELGSDSFRTLSIRLPFMFSESSPALFHPLLSFLSHVPFMPGTRTGVSRSMITYDGAARIAAHFLDRDDCGTVCAAARRPFDADLIARIIAEESGKRLRILSVPDATLPLLMTALPAFGRRMLQSSLLDPSANAGMGVEGLEDIEPVLRKLVRKYMRPRARGIAR